MLAASACHSSRYGTRYDDALPHIRRMTVTPTAVGIVTLHTGGMAEARPDLVAEVSPRLLHELSGVIMQRNVTATAVSIPTSRDAGGGARLSETEALASAVREAIFIHHYKHGKAETFEYSLGPAVDQLNDGPAEALLLVSLQAAVPSSGRVGLAVTAAVLGVLLTGLPMQVSTNQALLELMLIDSASGDVLWYNRTQQNTDVRQEGALRRLVRSAARDLLRPRREN